MLSIDNCIKKIKENFDASDFCYTNGILLFYVSGKDCKLVFGASNESSVMHVAFYVGLQKIADTFYSFNLDNDESVYNMIEIAAIKIVSDGAEFVDQF